MAIPKSDDVRAFSYWLRTGRRIANRSPTGVEMKFNPWHDPANGQFTFANSGVRHEPWGGSGGGSGWGGGGSSGTWSKLPRSTVKPSPAKQPQISKAKTHNRTDIAPTGLVVKPPVETFRRVTKNGYDFELDSDDNMRRASGAITLGTEKRNRRDQLIAGGVDRRPTDDGGHYIARRFNGPPDSFNLFPQDTNFNRGKYRLLEDEWARARRAGKKVEIEIVPRFEAGSKRPTELDVFFVIDGNPNSLKLPNEKQERPGAKR